MQRDEQRMITHHLFHGPFKLAASRCGPGDMRRQS